MFREKRMDSGYQWLSRAIGMGDLWAVKGWARGVLCGFWLGKWYSFEWAMIKEHKQLRARVSSKRGWLEGPSPYFLQWSVSGVQQWEHSACRKCLNVKTHSWPDVLNPTSSLCCGLYWWTWQILRPPRKGYNPLVSALSNYLDSVSLSACLWGIFLISLNVDDIILLARVLDQIKRSSQLPLLPDWE